MSLTGSSYKRALWLPSWCLPSSNHSLWGKLAAILWGGPSGKELKPVSSHVSKLGSGPSSPSQAFG